MFRLKVSNLPEDPTYPADLKALGFFINDVGQCRMIDYPDRNFVYYFSNQERHNDRRREALQMCQRDEVLTRLTALGLEKLYLPQLTYTKPKGEAYVPILAPPAEILKTRKRVIVLINDSLQDLGVLAYRQLQRELGINGGSVVNFVKEIVKRSGKTEQNPDIDKDGAGIDSKSEETPGLIVMNCGQLLFSYKHDRAMTLRSWTALPRKSMFHDAIAIMPENHIEGNESPQAHIKFVIDNVVKNKDFVSDQAEVYVIAIENGAENLLAILNSNLDYGSRITGMAVVYQLMTGAQITDPQLKAFLHQRARQWQLWAGSDDPREFVDAPSQEAETLDSSKTDQGQSTETMISGNPWLDTVSSPGAVSAIIDMIKRFALTVQPQKGDSQNDASPVALDDSDDMEPLCPSFADGPNPMGAGECIFTHPDVQRAILDFFEEVAKNPANYRNPIFKGSATSAAPTLRGGWGGDEKESEAEADNQQEEEDAAYKPLQPAEMSPEHAHLDAKKKELEHMRMALRNTPTDKPLFQPGRQGLEKRIAKVEREVEDLTKKALATGGLTAGEAPDMRENWKPQRKGPKVPFAGTMVDSEALRAAGLLDTAAAEEAALDSATEG